MKDARLIWLAFLTVIVVGAILILTTAKTRAHDAASGFQYPFQCCGGYDCSEIPSAFVKIDGEGYAITIPPGGHPQWSKDRTSDFTAHFKFDDAPASPDGAYHLCILGYADPPRASCFWHAEAGS